jgi:hypothetical protein
LFGAIAGVIMIVLVSATLLSANPAGQSPITSYTVGTQNWTVSAQIAGGQFGSFTYMTPGTVVVGALPIEVIAPPTGTSLIVDPDKTGASPPLINTDSLSYSMSKYSDGPQPAVNIGMSLVWHTDKNGQVTDPKVPDSSWIDSQGRYWERHYFIVQVSMQTISEPCTLLGGEYRSLTLSGRSDFNTEENAAEQVMTWLRIRVANPTNNINFTSAFSGFAKIIVPPQTTGNAIMMNGNPFTYYLSPNSPVYQDDKPNVIAYQNGGSALSPLNNSLGPGGGQFMFTFGGTLQAGVNYKYDYGVKDGTISPMDVLLTYGVFFAVDLSSPGTPVNPSLPPQWLQFFQYAYQFITQNSWSWVLIAAVVLLVVFALIFRGKGKGGVNIYLPGSREREPPQPPPQQPQLAKPEEKK